MPKKIFENYIVPVDIGEEIPEKGQILLFFGNTYVSERECWEFKEGCSFCKQDWKR